MKIAFIYGKQPSSTLTRLFTGSRCYHIGFTDGHHFWDMNLIRRRRLWDGMYPPEHVRLVECPVEVTAEYLDHKLDTDESTYGWKDYILFALRPVYHLFGRSTRNLGGVICSEMIAMDILECGVVLPWDVSDAPPSPADLEVWLLNKGIVNEQS